MKKSLNGDYLDKLEIEASFTTGDGDDGASEE